MKKKTKKNIRAVIKFLIDYKHHMNFFILLFALILILALIMIVRFEIFILFSMFVLCIISRLPMKFMSWSGFFDMNLILTVYASMQYGLFAGFFIATACLVSRALMGDIDETLIYDVFVSYLVAFITSFISIALFLPTMTTVAILFAIFHFVYCYYTDPEVFDITWTITYLVWMLFFIHKLLPLFNIAL